MEDAPLRWYQKISLQEKLFWLTILILFIVFSTLYFMASLHYHADEQSLEETKQPILEEYVIQLFPVDTVKDNLEENKEPLVANLNSNIVEFNRSVDFQIDTLFKTVENNVDKFLDFHYSVIGEYTELGAAATGKIENLILNKLFGRNYQNSIEQVMDSLNRKYMESIDDIAKDMEETALKEVDRDINQSTLDELQKNVAHFKVQQEGKLGVLLAARLGPKIAKLFAAKLTVKISAKFASKAVAKTAAKTAASSTGATVGAMCGPFVWVCSPVAAGTLWVATDVVFVIGDEFFNRDDLKDELLLEIKQQKQKLKNDLKRDYEKHFIETYDFLIKTYKEAEVVGKQRVKVKDKL